MYQSYSFQPTTYNTSRPSHLLPSVFLPPALPLYIGLQTLLDSKVFENQDYILHFL